MASAGNREAPCLDDRLDAYAASIPETKGTLSLFLVVTDHARERGLPLDADSLIVEGGGQVRRLGRPAVQQILARHGITEELAREGGRTSMGSVQRMRGYVDLLNRLHEEGLADPDAIEAFWITRVRDFLARRRMAPVPRPHRPRPRLVLDANRSPTRAFRELCRQAEARDPERGAGYSDAVLTHLVAAALDPVRPSGSPAAPPSPGHAILHVAASPGEAVIAACRDSLEHGHRPVLITAPRAAAFAAVLAEQAGIGERLDVLDIADLLATHLYLRSGFRAARLPHDLRRLVARYNEIVDREEADPSLRIRFRKAPARPSAGSGGLHPIGTMASARRR